MSPFPNRTFRLLLWVQGLYTLLTALWPLVDIESFMWVTGPKTDIWLVKTVGTCLTAIALTLLSYLFIHTHPLPAIVLGSCTAIGMATIDFYYSFTDRISAIYLLDGLVEVLFVFVWAYLALKTPHFRQ
jgi:hypothetical protein